MIARALKILWPEHCRIAVEQKERKKAGQDNYTKWLLTLLCERLPASGLAITMLHSEDASIAERIVLCSDAKSTLGVVNRESLPVAGPIKDLSGFLAGCTWAQCAEILGGR